MQLNRDLVAVSRYLRRQRNQYLEPFGLKGLHARYLIEVCEHPGISQDQLAQRLGNDKSNVARQVAFLEESGFICRSPGKADKRVLELSLTEKAQALLPGLQAATGSWEERLLRDLTQQERSQFTDLLARIRASITEEEVDPLG